MSENHDQAHDAGHDHSPMYYRVFGTLIAFTIITIACSFIPIEKIPMGKTGNVLLGIAIASFKASLVMLIFMHLKYEKRPIVVIALIPFALVLVLVMALFPDIVHGQYHQNTPAAASTEK